MAQDKKYNGWTNYETWNLNLWFDDAFTDAANNCFDADDIEGSIEALASHIESEVEEYAPKLDSGFFADVLNAALREVNYEEIAKQYIDELVIENDKAA